MESHPSIVRAVENLHPLVENMADFQQRDGGTSQSAALTVLAQLAKDNSRWPIGFSWAPIRESQVAAQLVKLFDNNHAWLNYSVPPELFLVSELVDVLSVDGGIGEAVELWRTRQLSFSGVRRSEFAALVRRQVVMENHDPRTSLGWHFHPLSKSGERLGYRMFFSEKKTQNDLWWEAHGAAPRRFGNPAMTSLQNAEGYYNACLHAVLKNGQFAKSAKYRSWSRNFVKASDNTYLAYCKNLERAGYRESFDDHEYHA